MLNRTGSAAFPRAKNRAKWPAHLKTAPNPREARSEPLSSADIDAQIRWFFENDLAGKPLRP